MRVLLVEDEPLLAMMLEEYLQDLGHQPVGAAASVDRAMELLNFTVIDCALLDYSLGGTSTSAPIAMRLSELGVPFCYLSGHVTLDFAHGVPEAPILAQPLPIGALETALARMDRLRLPENCPAVRGSPD